jgi:hypothetical protein
MNATQVREYVAANRAALARQQAGRDKRILDTTLAFWEKQLVLMTAGTTHQTSAYFLSQWLRSDDRGALSDALEQGVREHFRARDIVFEKREKHHPLLCKCDFPTPCSAEYWLSVSDEEPSR